MTKPTADPYVLVAGAAEKEMLNLTGYENGQVKAALESLRRDGYLPTELDHQQLEGQDYMMATVGDVTIVYRPLTLDEARNQQKPLDARGFILLDLFKPYNPPQQTGLEYEQMVLKVIADEIGRSSASQLRRESSEVGADAVVVSNTGTVFVEVVHTTSLTTMRAKAQRIAQTISDQDSNSDVPYRRPLSVLFVSDNIPTRVKDWMHLILSEPLQGGEAEVVDYRGPQNDPDLAAALRRLIDLSRGTSK